MVFLFKVSVTNSLCPFLFLTFFFKSAMSLPALAAIQSSSNQFQFSINPLVCDQICGNVNPPAQISHPSAGRTQRQGVLNLEDCIYLTTSTNPFYFNRTASHGRASSTEDEVNNCTQLYSRAKNTYASGHMHLQ